MPNIEINITASPSELLAFRRNEVNLLVNFSLSGGEPYWVEAIIEVNPPLSLAPDRSLTMGKMNVGIFSNNSQKERRVKIFSNTNLYPDTYIIKITALVYNIDGAIEERKEVKHEIECSEKNG